MVRAIKKMRETILLFLYISHLYLLYILSPPLGVHGGKAGLIPASCVQVCCPSQFSSLSSLKMPRWKLMYKPPPIQGCFGYRHASAQDWPGCSLLLLFVTALGLPSLSLCIYVTLYIFTACCVMTVCIEDILLLHNFPLSKECKRTEDI